MARFRGSLRHGFQTSLDDFFRRLILGTLMLVFNLSGYRRAEGRRAFSRDGQPEYGSLLFFNVDRARILNRFGSRKFSCTFRTPPFLEEHAELSIPLARTSRARSRWDMPLRDTTPLRLEGAFRTALARTMTLLIGRSLLRPLPSLRNPGRQSRIFLKAVSGPNCT